MRLVCIALMVSMNVTAATFIGDSIAHGYRIANNADGITKVGAGPGEVLGFVGRSPGDELAVVSTGASNNCLDISGIKRVINSALSKYARVVVLGAPVCGPEIRNIIINECQPSLCRYEEIKAGSDGIHPSNYNGMRWQNK